MKDYINGMIESAGGVWHLLAEQQPPRYGEYTVIKRGRSHHLDYDRLLWNGSSFVTHGHSLCNSVEAWKEEAGEVTGDEC